MMLAKAEVPDDILLNLVKIQAGSMVDLSMYGAIPLDEARPYTAVVEWENLEGQTIRDSYRVWVKVVGKQISLAAVEVIKKEG